jgi:hypothetical protein
MDLASGNHVLATNVFPFVLIVAKIETSMAAVVYESRGDEDLRSLFLSGVTDAVFFSPLLSLPVRYRDWLFQPNSVCLSLYYIPMVYHNVFWPYGRMCLSMNRDGIYAEFDWIIARVNVVISSQKSVEWGLFVSYLTA